MVGADEERRDWAWKEGKKNKNLQQQQQQQQQKEKRAFVWLVSLGTRMNATIFLLHRSTLQISIPLSPSSLFFYVVAVVVPPVFFSSFFPSLGSVPVFSDATIRLFQSNQQPEPLQMSIIGCKLNRNHQVRHIRYYFSIRSNLKAKKKHHSYDVSDGALCARR